MSADPARVQWKIFDIVVSDDDRERLAPAARARVISTHDNADLRE